MASQQPWMYGAEQRNDARFPATTFDPKAVTRSSWEPKPAKPNPTGPLLSFNRHPDAHAVLTYRSGSYPPMAPRTKKWIKRTRWIQLVLRVLELNGAMGILALMVILTGQDAAKGWVMRIAPGFVILLSVYAVYHLSRDAAGRTPASSAAYHVFAGCSDLATLGVYAFTGFTIHQDSDGWSNRIAGRADLTQYFVPAVYYTTVGAGGLHVISLAISLWLSYAFRKISLLPPDLNPLEDNLTARPKHKRNKSSMTTLTAAESDTRSSFVPPASRPGTGVSTSQYSVPRTVPFIHTREGSRVSVNTRDSRVDLPSRQYQIPHGNLGRNSTFSIEPRRMSRPVPSDRGSYAGIPLDEPSSAPNDDDERGSIDISRVGKFTESWAPTNSLVTRSNQRTWNAAGQRTNNRNSASYAALSSRYELADSSDSEYEDENNVADRKNKVTASDSSNGSVMSQGQHPNPLGSNPLGSPRSIFSHKKAASTVGSVLSYANPATSELSSTWSYRPDALSDMSPNSRRPVSEIKPSEIQEKPSETRDIADAKVPPSSTTPWQKKRDSSLQDDSDFYSKPYGELKSRTPPIMVGNDRKVSSGNDYGVNASTVYGRRNVSGKIAEEGLAGNRASGYRF